MNIITINLSTSLCCLLFLLFLLVSYFSRKNMNNIENLIYKFLLFCDALCLITYSSYNIFLIYANSLPDPYKYYELLTVFSRIGVVFPILWFSGFLIYVIVITNEKNNSITNFFKNDKKKLFIYISLYSLLIVVLCLLDKHEIFIENGLEKSPYIVYNLFLIPIIPITFIIVFINRKKINKRKQLPIYMVLPIMLCIFIFGLSGVKIIFIHIVISTINQLMYYTIENPDVQLITELQLAKANSEKANNAKSDFLSSMSHELRTPLNAIVGCTDLIMNSNNIDDIHEDCKDIVVASDKLLELVDGILDFNMIDSNNLELVESNYNPIELFNDVIHLNNSRIGDKNVTINSVISNMIPSSLYGDKNKVKTIINNILSNAVKYTNEGNIQFEASCFLVKDKCNLTITISDSGKGINDTDLEHIFDEFYRSSDIIDSNIEGTGLGLTITKSLIDLMEGKIVVNSTPDVGTTFIVTFSQKLVDVNNDVL